MSDKKHIDRLFQEKFKDFDVAPKEHVWKNIEARLQEKKKKRRVVPIWWQLGGVAAALLLMFAVGNSILNTQQDSPIIVETDDVKNSETNAENENLITPNKDENSSVVSNTSDSDSNNIEVSEAESGSLNTSTNNSNNSQNNSFVSNRNNRDALAQNTSSVNSNNRTSNSEINKPNTVASSNKLTDENSVSNKTELKSNEEINQILKSNTANTTNVVVKSSDSNSNKENSGNTETNNTSENKTDTVIKEKGQDIEEAIAESNKTIEKEEEEREIRRWSIAPNVAPVYFNSLGEGSSIDAQFNNNNTTSDISMSYGVKGSYAINSRLKVTAGVNRVSFNNTTNDVIALSDNSFSSVAASAGRIQNIDLKEGLNNSSLTLISRPNINANSVPESIRTIQTGDLEQRFGFIEIPLEIEYRLVDKKLGVNVSSGFSTLLLNDNEIFADVNGESTLLGEANNINNTSFSANFGVGIDYKLTEKLNINLEPKFKYQLNTFNNTSGDFRPFFIGVYTGLNFKF